MMKKAANVNDFNIKLHIIGRLWMLTGILLFIAVPVILAVYYKETPDWTVFGTAAVIIPLIINTGSGIVEPIVYAPMLGTNGEYLAFITGNLSNLKIPCVVKAQEIVGTKLGTEENELVSTIAIATSTLVTALVIGIMVLCLSLSGLSEVITKYKYITTPAFGCVVYALFGSLGGKYIAKNPKLSIICAIIIAVISAVMGAAVPGFKVGSGYLLVGIVLCVLFAVIQFVREKKKLAAKEETQRLAAIAAGISYESEVKIERIWAGENIENAESEVWDTSNNEKNGTDVSPYDATETEGNDANLDEAAADVTNEDESEH